MSPEPPGVRPALGDPRLLEAALRAWESCRPVDGALPEGRVPALLPVVAAHVPGGTASPERAERLAHFFDWPPGSRRGGPAGGPVRFVRDLRVSGGRVHFAHFWDAFASAAHAVARCGAARGAPGGELDAFREDVLEALEDAFAARGRWALPAATLSHLLEAAAATSAVPDFWRSLRKLGAVRDCAGELCLSDVGSALLLCLRRALERLRGAGQGRSRARAPGQGRVGPAAGPCGRGGAPEPPTAAPAGEGEGAGPAPAGPAVRLNIYDVSHCGSVHWFNAVFAHWLAPVKLGGAFHAGVEVHGLEWSFGATRRETLPGISCIMPRSDPQHHFRQTVPLGNTQLPMERVAAIISDLIEDYPGRTYDVLRRNCCHFADDFCRRLGVDPLPAWVHRLARLGAGADGAMQALLGTSPCELLPLASCRSLSGRPGDPPRDAPSCLAAAELLPPGAEAAGLAPL